MELNITTMFLNKQIDKTNNDLNGVDIDYYLNQTVDFKSSFGEFNLKNVTGYKARSGEYFIQQLVSQGVKKIVYVQPRRGFAGISLSWLCKKYNLDLILVMPASKEVSDHQALCIELGAKPMFARIAA